MRFWYVIKGYTDNDFSDEFKIQESLYKRHDHESVAEEIASEHFWRDPGDPSRFEHTIGVKDEAGVIKWFECTAEADVNFYTRETSE